MATDRIMVNLPKEVADILDARAETDKRSVSSLVALIIEADLRSKGLLPGTEDPRAQAIAAIDELGAESALKVLRRAARRQGVAT